MSLRARPCSGPADLAGIIELLLACQLHGYAEAELRSIELRVFLNNPALDVNRLTLLLEDGEPLPAAFAVLWQGRYLGMLVRPDQRGRLETRVIEWAVEQARASDWPSGRQPTLTALCRDDDALSREIYESIGFSLRDLELRMVRDLHEPIPEPTFPEGFTLRTLDSTTELKDWLRLYSNEIGTAPRFWSAGDVRAMMRTTTNRSIWWRLINQESWPPCATAPSRRSKPLGMKSRKGGPSRSPSPSPTGGGVWAEPWS